ncbi:early nodulin-like protein 15 [Elaeis guineensis]|uniref:early nodulin-like protein 15 n=1 Tax=Elaeis guineensis var. tenera TaxID=51953 RepID=UPI003C6CCF5C
MSSSSLLFLILLFINIGSEAREHLVGGNTKAWKVPSSTSESLNQWAGATRFQVGDSLVWKYDGEKDSVLQVRREDYLSCNTSSPVAEHKDGTAVVKLHWSGPYYFISGAEGACEKGEKLIVVVMSERHALRRISPAPSPMEYDGPSIAPTSGALMVVQRKGLVAALVVLGTVGVVLRVLDGQRRIWNL